MAGTVSGFALGGENFCLGGGGQLKLSRETGQQQLAAKRVGLNELPAKSPGLNGTTRCRFWRYTESARIGIVGRTGRSPSATEGNAPRCFVALFLLEALICRRRNFAGGGRS